MRFLLPRVYPILDSSYIPVKGRADFLTNLGSSLADAGITMLEYRNKNGTDDELRSDAAVLRTALPEDQVKLILDDRAHLVCEIGFDGVHVDAGDASPKEARKIVGPGRIVGTFGGSEALIPGILDEPVNYWAVGPVFRTTTKETDRAPIGPEGVRRLREVAGPDVLLTAAAGITLETACLVLDAGADAVAIAAAIFGAADPAAEFRRWRERLG